MQAVTVMMQQQLNKIAELNDHARRTFTGCRVIFTAGIAALPQQTQHSIIATVQRYDDFTQDNDPYAEHDFGSFTCQNHHVFWKWDYFDLDLQMASLDPSVAEITTRILTIMLAHEY
jgi:hypothetical protein